MVCKHLSGALYMVIQVHTVGLLLKLLLTSPGQTSPHRIPRRCISYHQPGTSQGHPFKGHRQAKKAILWRETGRFSSSLAVICIRTIAAVSLGFGVSLHCASHPSGLTGVSRVKSFSVHPPVREANGLIVEQVPLGRQPGLTSRVDKTYRNA